MKRKSLLLLLNLFLLLALLLSSCLPTINPGKQEQPTDPFHNIDNSSNEPKNDGSGTKVNIPDPELEKFLRAEINKPSGDLTTADLERVQRLVIYTENYPITDLTGIEYCINVHTFRYRDGYLASTDPLANLDQMLNFTLNEVEIGNVSKKFNMPNLKVFTMNDTNLKDLSFLSKLLVPDLSLWDNDIDNLDFLKDNTELTDLRLSYNLVKDISPLANKTKLEILHLDHNEIVDIDVLSTCTSLRELNLSYNKIKTLAPILSLNSLKDLTIHEDPDFKIFDRSEFDILLERGVEIKYRK